MRTTTLRNVVETLEALDVDTLVRVHSRTEDRRVLVQLSPIEFSHLALGLGYSEVADFVAERRWHADGRLNRLEMLEGEAVLYCHIPAAANQLPYWIGTDVEASGRRLTVCGFTAAHGTIKVLAGRGWSGWNTSQFSEEFDAEDLTICG